MVREARKGVEKGYVRLRGARNGQYYGVGDMVPKIRNEGRQ